MPEVQARLREARDRLSTSELEVGRFYYRIRWYPGAIDRLSILLKEDPQFSGRDEAYFLLGEAFIKLNRPPRRFRCSRSWCRSSRERAPRGGAQADRRAEEPGGETFLAGSPLASGLSTAGRSTALGINSDPNRRK